MKPRTHTVTGGYVSRDGKRRVYVKDHPLPLECDEALEDGAAVRIEGRKAVRAR